MEIKLCVKCKHFEENTMEWHSPFNQKKYANCRRYSADPVLGLGMCQEARKGGWLISRLEGLCGKEGRFWEPK